MDELPTARKRHPLSKRRYAYPIISVLFISGIVLWQVNKHAAIYAGISLLVLLLIFSHNA